MTLEELAEMLEKTGFPFAYDHFAEGESPDPPFICYLLPGSDNFAADGRVYFRISEVRIELYTDRKYPGAEALVETVLAAQLIPSRCICPMERLLPLHRQLLHFPLPIFPRLR